jgi:tetratricopeptide (TPR) repeat protein
VAPGVAPTPGTPSAPTRVATPPPAAPATQIAVAAGPAQATPRPRPPEPAPAKPLEAPSKPAQKQPPAWLEQAAPAAAAGAPSSEALFEEDGFFDLAGELERELSEEELAAAVPLAPPQEQSLEEIVEGFKRGVAETLSPEDYDTHFNLGIAYREMGLLDEAIGEFQLAAKSPDYLIDCCSLLGACFLEKGLPDLAIRWYQKGLATPNLSEDATLGLLYDLGNLYQTIGETEKARKAFVEIYGVNSSYRDVRARLEELGG